MNTKAVSTRFAADGMLAKLARWLRMAGHDVSCRRDLEQDQFVSRAVKERRVVLTVLDRRWREHLYEMDYLREGIGLRAMAQRNPLVEYQREGYDMFASMMEGIKEESVGLLFNIEVKQPEPTQAEGAPVLVADGLVAAKSPAQLEYTAPTVDGSGGVMHRTVTDGAADADEAGDEGTQEPGDGTDAAARTRGRRTRSKGRRR